MGLHPTSIPLMVAMHRTNIIISDILMYQPKFEPPLKTLATWLAMRLMGICQLSGLQNLEQDQDDRSRPLHLIGWRLTLEEKKLCMQSP